MSYALKRHYGRNDLHFITFRCYQRKPFLAPAGARNLLIKILAEVRARYRFKLIGFVLMPKHVHLLLSEPPACLSPGCNLAKRVRELTRRPGLCRRRSLVKRRLAGAHLTVGASCYVSKEFI